MESGYELPVIVPLTAGAWYEFVFIADSASKFIEARLYDYNEKQVVYQKKSTFSEGNIIHFSYIPRFDEFHMFKPVQLYKPKKKLCGRFMLFKR